MAQLPIRSLTLWKQGFGYFERRGKTTEQTLSLIVPRDATNDVLKSLNISLQDGGQVLSVDYETPEDKREMLNNLSVKLTDRSSMVDLLVSLRGSVVSLLLDNDQQAIGRLIGVEASLEDQPATVILQSTEDISQLHNFPIHRLQGVQLNDDRATTDIGFFLDVSRVEQTRTTLTVRVSEGENDIAISYLSPSPIWRMSYRLVKTDMNTATLTAWGIFENSMDEDLEDVSVTLISGRPISFIYDLYKSRVPPRPEISDDTSTMEQMAKDPRVVEAMSAIAHDLRTPMSSIAGYAEMLLMEGSLTNNQKSMLENIRTGSQRLQNMTNDLLSLIRLRDDNSSNQSMLTNYYRSGPLGDLKVSGRYFSPVMMSNANPQYMTYKVDNAISVKRGQSAMVPLLSKTLTFEMLVVYNGDKMPNHPLKVWSFQNTTGFALEQGPITIVNEGYAGEGLMQFSGIDDMIQIPFALEFGILVEESTNTDTKTLYSLEFDADKQQARVERSQITSYDYTLTSRVDSDHNVFIERRDPNRGEYYQMKTPDFTSAGHSRWAINVPEKSIVEFTVRIREISQEWQDIMKWSTIFIAELSNANLISSDVQELFDKLLTEKQVVRNANSTVEALQAEQRGIQILQEQLRKNLGALGNTDREETIRNQILDDLENSENRRREIDTEINFLQAQTSGAQARQQEIKETILDS